MAKNTPYTTGGRAKRVVRTGEPGNEKRKVLNTPAKVVVRKGSKPKAPVNTSSTYGIMTSGSSGTPAVTAVTMGKPKNKNSSKALKGKIRG